VNQPDAPSKYTPHDATFRVEGPVPLNLDRALRQHYEGASWAEVRRLVSTNKVTVNGVAIHEPTYSVAPQSEIAVRINAPRMRSVGVFDPAWIVHFDAHIVVINKPTGLSTVPHGEEQDTLEQRLGLYLRDRIRAGNDPRAKSRELGANDYPEIVHRIDKETSGLLVFARSVSAKHSLKNQFAAHDVHRRYLALVHGHMASQMLRSRLVRDRGDGLRGSTDDPTLGKWAVTHSQTLETLTRATLMECRLETGRTHQIRIHLAEVGHPLIGEHVYIRDFRGERIEAPRAMLHAAELGFIHPVTREHLEFKQEPPEDFINILNRERKADVGSSVASRDTAMQPKRPFGRPKPRVELSDAGPNGPSGRAKEPTTSRRPKSPGKRR
jgi:23S rRNA pseudouridine1911/1915/1917 synthase